MTSDDFKGSAKDIRGRAEEVADSAKSGLKTAGANAADQAEGIAGQVRAVAGDIYAKTQDNIRAAVDGMPDSAADAVSAGQRLYKTGSKQVGRQVMKQPIEALLLAGAIGYLVGWATSRT